MTVVPRYNYAPGTELTLLSQKLILNGSTKTGYEFSNLDDGALIFIPSLKFIEYLKLPGVTLDAKAALTGSKLQERLGGYASWKGLPAEQRRRAEFHHSTCQAMSLLRDKTRAEKQDPDFHLSIRKMDEPENRRFVCRIASGLLGQRVELTAPRGGKSDCWFLYKGRTLMRYFTAFEKLRPDENPLDVLVTLDHLKGNSVPRISWRLKELMKQAWEEIGLDTKDPSVANVLAHLRVLIHEENAIRKRNGLDNLIVPAASTLKKFREEFLTPTEYLGATKGEQHARNQRGRGAPDIRALLIGEQVEIDECKISLVTSAREKGVWGVLSSESRTILEEIDEEIRSRLILLVMIDVASRMPLAWVLSDQPKAIATLALFRMATRDKTREKSVYGCDGDPVRGIGLGNVRMDNGTGLRNLESLSALMGTSAMATVVRAYNSTDKPYVERLLGTTESVLLKLIHGYTGRKAGDLPAYDATANGVLDIDELYGIITRYFIDEYASTAHMGLGMGGRCPYEVYKYINETRGIFMPLDDDMRRIHLGWEVEATPNDEGVRVFSGLYFSSPMFQEKVDSVRGKVSVFVDPDDVSEATVLVPGIPEPFRVQIQTTAFADLTLPQVLELVAAHRNQHPSVTELHNDRVMSTRRQRFDQLRAIGVERKLTRSYSTFEECKNKARAVFAGVRVVRPGKPSSTVSAGSVTQLAQAEGTFQLGSDHVLIEGTAVEEMSIETDLSGDGHDPTAAPQEQVKASSAATRVPANKTGAKPQKRRNPPSNDLANQFLGRPTDLGELE